MLYRTRQGLRRGKAPRRQYPCAPAMGSPGGSARNLYSDDDESESGEESEGDDLEEGEEPRIHQEMVEALLAYGAEPSVPEDSHFGNTLLHVASVADDPVALARLLISAGANIDARSRGPNCAGLTPLTWSIRCGEGQPPCYDLAIILIEQGCDVVQAAADYASQFTERSDGALLDLLDGFDRTVENRHLVDVVTAALDAAGPERYRAAADAARQYSSQTHNGEYA